MGFPVYVFTMLLVLSVKKNGFVECVISSTVKGHALQPSTTSQDATAASDGLLLTTQNQDELYILRQEAFYNNEYLDIAGYRQLCPSIKQVIQNVSDQTRALLSAFPTYSEHDACCLTAACQFNSGKDYNYCRPVLDAVGTCYPKTRAGEVASVKCPTEIAGIPYYQTDNVTRDCLNDGVWAPRSNYSACRPILDKNVPCSGKSFLNPNINGSEVVPQCEEHFSRMAMMTYVGRGLSLTTLSITFIIFWTLRSIRCWRIIIHWNLTSSLILRNLFWIFLHCSISWEAQSNNEWYCRVLVTVFNYAQYASYFWMFVEGLYLHMMIVLAYSTDRFKLRTYMVIGWGIPVPFVGIWAILKYQLDDQGCWINTHDWTVAGFFYHIPILCILSINAVILANIVRILCTKLRQMRGVSRSLDYMKAVKAALFLFPLLGFTFIIFLVMPETGANAQLAFMYFNLFLLSFQGVFVCVIYCFANSEIQTAVSKAFRSWKSENRFPCCRKASHRSRFSSLSISRSYNTTQAFRVSKSQDNFIVGPPPSPPSDQGGRRSTVVSSFAGAAPRCHLADDEAPLSEMEQRNCCQKEDAL